MSLELRVALDKVAAAREGRSLDASLHTTSITYSPVDKAAAKGVLSRLLDIGVRREVSYIRIVAKEVEEN